MVAVISARPLWLKTVRVASALSYGACMRLRVRHGLLGEITLTMDVMERTTLGWDVMKQMAKVLKLDSPFQVVLYADISSVIQSPLRAVRLDTAANEVTFCYIVQSLQVPSAQQYQDLMTAIYQLSPWQGIRPYGRDDGGRAHQHTSSLCYPSRPFC